MMTITKQYIELNDILEAVVKCGNCKASVSMPMASDHMRVPGNCPHCGVEWSKTLPPGLTTSHPSKAEWLAQFFKAFHRLKNSLDSDSEPAAFTFSLEIAVSKKEGI